MTAKTERANAIRWIQAQMDDDGQSPNLASHKRRWVSSNDTQETRSHRPWNKEASAPAVSSMKENEN